MSSTNRSDVSSVASEVLTPPAEEARTCTDRQRRLTEYIRSHTGANVAVRLTPFVPTACVMPTSREKLVDSDNADLSREEAQRIVNSVDADYLVLISTDPAAIDRLPFSDQLTADRSQQYGYALHELGHIRYTAIATCASMLRDRVEKGYQEFVKGIWNSVEDTAIENQLAFDQSQLAADRLEIVNRSISKPADEFPPERTVTFSFRDAIERALYDRGIYDTGIDERLCDSENDQFVFASEADQQAFAIVDDSIDTLLGTILTTPSSVQRAEAVLDWWENELEPLLSPPDQDERDEQQQEPNTEAEGPSQDSAQQQPSENGGEPSPDQQGQDDGSQQAPDGEPDDEQGGGGEEPDQRPDPSEINTDQRQESAGSDTLEYPDIGEEEDADALTHPEEDDAEGSEGESEHEGSEDKGDSKETDGEEGPESNSSSDSEDAESDSDADSGSSTDNSENESKSTTEPDREQVGGGGEPEDSDSEGEALAESSESPSEDHDSADESGSESNDGDAGDSPSDNPDGSEIGQGESDADTDGGEGASGETSPNSSASNPWMGANDSGQTQSSLGSFGESADESPTDSEQSSPEGEDTSSTAGDSSTQQEDGESESERGAAGSGDNDEEIDTDHAEQTESDPDKDGEQGEKDDVEGGDGNQDSGKQEDEGQENEQPAPPDPSPAHEGSDLENSDALDTDRQGAHNEAKNATPDGSSLERDLEDAGKALENLNEDEEAEGEDERDGNAEGGSQDTAQSGSGTGATPGSLDELSIMPNPDTDVATSLISERFDAADRDAEHTAGALRKALKENQQSGTRTGLTSGSFDRRRAGDLARGQINVFQVNQQGEEKKYDLILILDRSISMRNIVGTAEDAIARFAIACEDIGINVGILDFYQDEARLVKPFSVETQFVQSSLLTGDRKGNTPLSDALSIGNELLEQRWNSPLVLVVTDGKPGDAERYQDVLSATYAPVCGLTLCLGRSRDTIPEQVSQNERYYDRHMYVFDGDNITNRLGQFATSFAGL